MPKNSWCVLLGAGAGYLLQALMEAAPYRLERLLVWEPFAEVYHHPRVRTLAAEILRDEMCYQHTMEGLGKAIQKFSVPSFCVFVLPAYRRVWPDGVDALLLQLQKQGTADPSQNIDSKTKQKFLRLWTAHALRRCFDKKDNHLEFLINKSCSMDDLSVVYCGAGPTLEEDLQCFGISSKRKSPTCFLISSDTALPFLLYRGYSVDLCVSVDAGAASRWHFAMLGELQKRGLCELPLSIPVLTWLSGPLYYEEYFRKTIFYRSRFPIDQILAEGPLADIPEWENPSRNVAGLALLFAASQGFRRVCLAGSRFRSSSKKSHVGATGYELYARCFQNRLNGLSVYQSGAYDTLENSPKNRQAINGLRQMARSLQLDLIEPGGERFSPEKKIASWLPPKTSAAEKTAPFSVSTQPILRTELALTLGNFLSVCSQRDWQQIQLPSDWHKKAQRIASAS